MLLLELNILTLNVWGIPYVSSDRALRIEAICKELSSGKYDIVSLQEVWSQKDSEALQEKTASALPYSHYFHSGVMGAGLLVLSKYPILGTLFHAWSVNGYFHRVQHADWFGGKGVGLCRILVGDQIVHLYNAHLHAEYDNDNDEYKTHRVIQAFDTAQFIEATRGNAVLQILAGDLNTQPQDISYKVLLYTSKMQDSCASDAFRTNECGRNSYTSKRSLAKNPLGIRIDHIFVRGADHIKAHIVDYTLPFPERVPGEKFSYSDHEAVLAKLRLTHITADSVAGKHIAPTQCVSHANGHIDGEETCATKEEGGGDPGANISATNCGEPSHKTTCQPPSLCLPAQRTAALHEALTLCDASLLQLNTDRILYYSAATFLFVLLVLLIEFSAPVGFRTIYLLLKFIVFGVILFCIFMASIWNYMERNGVLQGKKSMEVMLHHAQKYEYFY
ncbi:putative neutral sphingomyelinase [Scaptodrosophila lebanonensis]|uniref:sphingomyelin phosphodiesterase n=1 Tax=Drosophila lebanonensis TaxID=7225 RepID=A0A6J2T9M4_DROLE|nr:putative neutral sphingomyelinase [Scaptodrosophila lebanonensis]